MAKNAFGLKSILVGDIAGDGGMGTTLTELFGHTVRDSAILESTEPETTDIFIEESEDPIQTITTSGGSFEFRWSTYNVDPVVLAEIFGGTVTGTAGNETWNAPDTFANVEMSLRATTSNNLEISAPRVKIIPKMTLNMQRTNGGQVDLIARVLKPTKALEPKLKIGPAA